MKNEYIVMKFMSIPDLKHSKVQGFKSVDSLRATNLKEVPEKPGVYLVIRDSFCLPSFLPISLAGRYKQREPTCEIAVLEEKWNYATPVLYIGKAGGKGTKSTLRRRIDCYLRHGSGKCVAHWGGRYIWQLKDSNLLLFAWIEHQEPRFLEKEYLRMFKEIYSKYPFANLGG